MPWHIKDVDYVLTTREVVSLLASNHITAESAPEAPFDKIMGSYTGAGVIFGATGGVMEAALRSAYYFVTGELPPVDAFNFVDAGSSKPWQEAEFDVAGTKLRIAVASGLGNADIIALYDEFLEKPMGEKSEHLLHTDHFAWKMPTEKARSES